jgi:hypothetical protein
MRITTKGRITVTTITIPTKVITFEPHQKQRWIIGDHSDCIDPYCRSYEGSRGFGEYLVGKHFESQGYLWIHHDFNLFGGNKLGKYPRAEEVLHAHLGKERYEHGRVFAKAYAPYVKVEEPDLLIYKPDYSEVRFAEVKRHDTRDKLREQQVVGLALLSLLFGCPVEVFEVCKKGNEYEVRPVVLELA